VEIIADSVQFLGGRQEAGEPQFVPAGAQASDDFGSADDDIPF
jgi:single-stranded DNA-binding protein